MILGNDDSAASVLDHPSESGSKGFPIDIFKRDYRLWLFALLNGWVWLAAVPLVLACIAYVSIKLFTPRIYESGCALVRSELPDPRHGGMPEGYSPVQRAVLMNMMLSRQNLEKTIARLNLRIGTSQLYSMFTVKQPQKNANYFTLSVTARDPALAAELANTQADVFIEDYKTLIKSSLTDLKVALVANSNGLHEEISNLEKDLKRLNGQYGFLSIDSELDKLNNQIINVENQLYVEDTRRNSYQEQLSSLKATLEQTKEEVQVYEEKSTEAQMGYERAVMELAFLRQRYTEENPIVKKQIENVKVLEANLKKVNASNLQSKVVFGKNPIYTNLKTDIIKREVELAGTESRYKEYTTRLSELKQKRATLDSLRPEFKKITDELALKNHLLKRVEESKKSLEMFLDRGYSDISVYEPAVAPKTPIPKKTKVILFIVMFFGEALTVGALLLKELLNFKVRSRADIEDALHLRVVGAIPELKSDQRMIFYSAIQKTVTSVEKLLEKAPVPVLMMSASTSGGGRDAQLEQNIFEVLDVKNVKVLRIYSSLEMKAEYAPYIINDYLYSLTECLPEPDDKEALYFVLDDMAFIAPPPPERVKKLCEQFKGYDLILWDLFEYEQNSLLFRRLCELSALTVFPMRFNIANKLKINRQVKELREHGVDDLSAVLYDVKIKYYPLAE